VKRITGGGGAVVVAPVVGVVGAVGFAGFVGAGGLVTRGGTGATTPTVVGGATAAVGGTTVLVGVDVVLVELLVTGSSNAASLTWICVLSSSRVAPTATTPTTTTAAATTARVMRRARPCG
jgi:hypothetical protein